MGRRAKIDFNSELIGTKEYDFLQMELNGSLESKCHTIEMPPTISRLQKAMGYTKAEGE